MESGVPRILVIDDDAVTRHVVEGHLRRAGYETLGAEDGDEGLRLARTGNPSLVLLDLVLPPSDGYGVLRALREDPLTREVPVVVLTGLDADAEVERAFASGADDFLRKPMRSVELLARIRSQLRLRGYLVELGRKEHDAQVMVELTHTLASSLDVREILFTVVRRIAEVLGVERCSIVVAREAGDLGYVVAASDDAAVRNLPIALDRYPEIQKVLQGLQPLTIDDASTHPLFDDVRERVTAAPFRSLTLVPIAYQDRAMGVLFLRAGDRRARLGERELSFCQIVANATAVALRNARVLQKLREESAAETSARTEAERRARALERYMDLFLSSADGIMVIDHEGSVLHANPRAAEITGYSVDALRGMRGCDIVSAADQPMARALAEGFLRGDFPVNVDVRTVHASGAERELSLSTSSVLREDQAVLLTFRDVTEDRATARELARTREFFSLLIESVPDAIVAAELDGTVLLFNSAAERVFGARREDVVGKRSVLSLYPEGGARELMRRIRQSPEQRVAGVRTEALSLGGERIPILLSAALVTDRGKAVASVGVFSDLRERLKMEERLAQAQQQLALTERQAVLTELAGAAAHELNQPLTAIQGYAEILRRKNAEDPSLVRGLDVILRETERMAELVRRIGSITRYETVPYVGGASIIDLERSTAPVEKRSSKPPPPSTPPDAAS